MKKNAFTLIELLIVVAIIAILAAIAVPNFLEAQVRSKVARVKADMRSLATAQEAYRVDYNSYTFNDRVDPGLVEGWRCLTSPVAYITSIPADPFGVNRAADSSVILPAYFELGTGRVGVMSAGNPWSPYGWRPEGMPSDTYEMNSAGPDKVEDTNSVSGGWDDDQYPMWAFGSADAEANIQKMSGLIYDSTNGTKSRGEILRVGGVKPNGRMFELLWSAGSR
jgi:prepilin-type N-terminal cleavage/methylation domain-containing protein